MRGDSFGQQMQAVRGRVAELERCSGHSPIALQLLAPAALEELQIALEELEVAEEELRQQNEELLATREAVEAERHRYEELFQFAPDSYLVTDPEGIIREANHAAATLLQAPLNLLAGKPVAVFVVQEARPAFRTHLTRLAALSSVEPEGTRGAPEWAVRLQPRGGAPVDVAVTVAAVRDRGDKLVALRWLLRDITERKRLEQELRRHAGELAESDRRKDEFMAMLGHELRNPLGAMSNALHLIRLRGADDPILRKAVDVMDRQVRHQAHLIDDLLNVTRIARGKITLCCRPLDLAWLVRETTEDRRGALEEAALTLTLELPKERIAVSGDPTRLAQILDNLLQNAIKFTDRGGRVTVSVARETHEERPTIHDSGPTSSVLTDDRSSSDVCRSPPPCPRVAVTVCDTGIGLSPEMLPRVFENFTQADRTLDRSRGGLGLGLALVKGLVELHGGTVRVGSAGPGRGTEFTFVLPIVPADGWEAEPENPPPALRLPSPSRILVVEDNRDAAETLREILELAGHTVAVSLSGSDGVEAARRFRPEVVLCDLGLPGMDGYQVAAALRRDPLTASARLIALTGYGQEEDRRRTREAGFDVHLTKPVDPAALQHLLCGI
jgi:PAS domain S-box-containing protein